MIEIELGGRDRIWLRSPYDPGTIAACKRIAGAGWSKRASAWTFPRTVETCLRLREEFGARLKIRPEVSAWYRAELERRSAMGSLASAARADLLRVPEVAPALAKAMFSRPFQPVGARFIADGRAVLIADDPGLGKTLEVLGGVIEAKCPGPHLVICPKTAVQSVWAREIPRWLVGQEVLTVPDGKAKRDAILTELATRDRRFGVSEWPANVENTWLVIHPEMAQVKSYWECEVCGEATTYTKKPTPTLACEHPKTSKTKVVNAHKFPQLFDIEWGSITVDESHEMLVVKSGTPTQRRRGAELLRGRIRPDGLAIAASGTPMRGKPEQLWGTLNWLAPKRYSGKWRWIQQYWETGGYTGWEIGKIKPDREQMMWNEISPIVLRRTKAEVASDLPPKTYMGTPYDPSDFDSPVGIWLPMLPAQAKAYAAIEKDSAVELESGRLNAIGELAEMTRLQQFASAYGDVRGGDFMPSLPSNKFDWVQQFLEEMGIPSDPTGKIVIVSRFTRLLNMFYFGLFAGNTDGMACVLTGETKHDRRADMIESFNRPVGTDSPHVMFLNVKAGGVAITIDSADDMVLLDEADSDAMIQVEDRIHRISKPRPVRYHYLRSEGTVDVGIALVNSMRAGNTRRVMDERRGVSFARAVMEASR